MNIIFDADRIDFIKANNVVLELDTFYFSKLNKTVTAYCVIENVKIIDLNIIEHNLKLHNELIDAYKNKNFKLCKNLINTLTGTFNGEVDSFYQDLNNRVNTALTNPSRDWDPIILKND